MEKWLPGVAIILLIAFSIPVLVLHSVSGQVFEVGENYNAREVGIVFGAGLRNQVTPSDILRDRLEVTAELYHEGSIERILVSGDNRFESYSEPAVMFDVLVNDLGVSEEDVYQDFAGRRTYDTCVRAGQIWGIESAILISQRYHLPRAIWTCERLGIQSMGVSASLQTYLEELRFQMREIFAIYKAVFDIYLIHPSYIGGEFIKDLDL